MTTPNTPTAEQEPFCECPNCANGMGECQTVEQQRIAADLANLRYKQSGGPAKDNQARAVKLEQQCSEAARLAGWAV